MSIKRRHALIAGALLCVAVAALIHWERGRTSIPPQRAYYFWKTQWTAPPQILQSFTSKKIDRLYMRFFDVEWDEFEKSPQPVSPLKFQAPPPVGVEIVPVVYIVNAVFLKLAYKDVETLANNVWMKVAAMAADHGVAIQQLQIDCDWTDSTRRSYFHLAELLSLLHRVRSISTFKTFGLFFVPSDGRVRLAGHAVDGEEQS